MGLALNVQILSASDAGGVYPFVSVCFDGDVTNELYKTDATNGGHVATWNHTFQLDLTSNEKALKSAGRSEPTYLTFFLYDTGTQGIPPLGSAGVLLDTVKEHGKAQGDFPIVNGSGTLRLIVTGEKTKRGRFGLPAIVGGTGDPIEDDEKFGNAARVAGAAAGLAALGGLGYAVHQKRKKKKKDGENDNEDDEDDAEQSEGKKSKRKFFSRNKGGDEGAGDDDEHEAIQVEQDDDDEDDEEGEEK